MDDFAIAAPDQHTADILMDLLDDQLTMPIKRQGLLDMFNSVDVVQMKHHIKIDCHTYIAKYLATWMNKVPLSENRPTPLPSDADWLRNFNAAAGSDNPKELGTLETSMQIKSRGGVGELIWAMTTCRPDIAFTSIKLSQSNSRPAEIHYQRTQTRNQISLHNSDRWPLLLAHSPSPRPTGFAPAYHQQQHTRPPS